MKKAISLIVSGEIIHYYIPDFLHFYRGWCSKNCQCLRGWKGIPNGFYWSCPLRYGGKTFSHLLFGPFFKIFPANCTCLLIYIHLSLLTFLLSFKIEGMKVTTQPSFLLSLSPKKKKAFALHNWVCSSFFFLDTCKGLTFHDKNHLFHANFLAWRKNIFFSLFFISPFLKRLHFYLSHIFFCLL